MDMAGVNSLRGNAAAIAYGIAERISAEIVREARARSRVDTGAMQSGWGRVHSDIGMEQVFVVENDRASKTREARSFADENMVTYYNEYGTRFMPAQPMLGPATENALSGVDNIAADLIETAASSPLSMYEEPFA